ncbi:MAG: hypothetical protein LBO63_00335 [Oscillospiraceae bacterium]|nr:hypothetical protein [Oscillospiraceae bacterium]
MTGLVYLIGSPIFWGGLVIAAAIGALLIKFKRKSHFRPPVNLLPQPPTPPVPPAPKPPAPHPPAPKPPEPCPPAHWTSVYPDNAPAYEDNQSSYAPETVDYYEYDDRLLPSEIAEYARQSVGRTGHCVPAEPYSRLLENRKKKLK